MDTIAATNTVSSMEQFILEHHGQEPEWLLAKRRQYGALHLEMPLPVRQRTPLKNRKLERIPVLVAQPRGDLSTILAQTQSMFNLITVNGRSIHVSLPESAKSQGVVLLSLQDALQRSPELVQESLGTVVDDTADKFQALNAALWQDGLFIYVPPRAALTEPITISHYGSDDATAILPRTLVVLDRESHATINEHYVSESGRDKCLWSCTTEIILHDAAVLQYGAIQQLSASAEAFIRRAARVGRDARIDWNIGEFGAGLVVSEHLGILDQPGGQTYSTTVFFGSQSQHQDYTATARHVAPHTASNMIARGVMNHSARSVFTGVTDIRKGAVGSDGRQKEKILMLSDTARADAIPSLLIEENDVFAAHAASAGPIDTHAIFYLMGRGLSETEATRLIVHGFLAPVIDTIPVGALRDEVWAQVERKILE